MGQSVYCCFGYYFLRPSMFCRYDGGYANCCLCSPQDAGKESNQKTFAHTNCAQMFAGSNLQAFLIGRLTCLASCIFIFARISTPTIEVDIIFLLLIPGLR
mmetsp:Transcript_46005/g.67887  ORF Transcript_46005/g.67887 Transcript_46005/m.67887 type:complete len:101 (+) Transcript_46005:2099-2401(+)